jgi:HlyD family secretion protein
MYRILQLIFILFVLSACSTGATYVQPERKPLLEAVYASGFVVSEDEYQVFAQVDGYVSEKVVNDGDEVEQGDPLYIIEADQQNARYRMAREAYEQALLNYREDSPILTELRASVSSARSKMQFDSTTFVRYANLYRQQATTVAEYDRMKLMYENSRNDYLLAQSRYKRAYDQVVLEFKNAENQYKIVRDESARYIIRSQVKGMVFKTFKEKGELIRRTELAAIVGSMESFYLQLTVDELDIQRIKKGQRALVKIDAYPGRVFNAEVMRVFPLVDTRQQSIRVDARLLDELPAGFSGLALEANIIIRESEKALVIPKSAVLPGDSIIVTGEQGEQKIRITRGITTLNEVEVVAGITADAMVKINP